LELLEEGSVEGALECLQKYLTPRKQSQDELCHLAGLMVYKDKVKLFEEGKEVARKQVLENILRLMTPKKLADGKRLETLIQQAIQYQISKCNHHNTVKTNFSLLEDHKCKNNEIPAACVKTLSLNGDEIWETEFTADGKYLATISRNNVVIIWEFTKISAENTLKIRAVLFTLIKRSGKSKLMKDKLIALLGQLQGNTLLQLQVTTR